MSSWSLPILLTQLHEDIQQRLRTTRKTFGHPDAKGDASEAIWLGLLQKYLPKRYRTDKAYVVDSNGTFSDQIDLVIYDQQYSPFIFHYEDQIIVPAESVYAIFEVKQTINANHVAYARNKVSSVRKLHRTSLPIPYAGGEYSPKPLIPILGGILTLESDWSPCFGEPLRNALEDGSVEENRLHIGCVAAHGHFFWENDVGKYTCTEAGKPATAFLFNLISMLQVSSTVPMIDVSAYAEWLAK